MSVLADSSYPLLNVFWTMLIFFSWVIWIWLLLTIFMDLFSRHDVSGWGKGLWTVALLVLPFIGALIYLITQSSEMAQRRAKAVRQQQEFLAYQSGTASNGTSGSTASEISKAKELLDSGAITPDEYAVMKQKALTG
jgi:hypothetical protein